MGEIPRLQNSAGLKEGAGIVTGFVGPVRLDLAGGWPTDGRADTSGTIVGAAIAKVGATYVPHFFQYSGGVMVDLGVPSWFTAPSSWTIRLAEGNIGPGRSVSATGINDSGIIVGCVQDWSATSPYVLPTRAVYYDGSFHTIPMLPGDVDNCATGINSSGVIVGWSVQSGHPWQYAGGTLTDLGVAPNWQSVSPTGINGSGTIVGIAIAR